MPTSERLPTVSIPHGGGPWPFMKDAFGDPAPYERMEAWLKKLGNDFKNRISSILVISAHWEEAKPTIHFGANPPMLYDYGGFPDFAYKLNWPAPGNPVLAAKVEALLQKAGFETGRETARGYDHGTFIPLMLAFPEATIPVAQLSLVRSLDPEIHVRMGVALESLRDEGVLIIGSGMSYHNMRGFMGGGARVAELSRAFDTWLCETAELTDSAERDRRLINWKSAPAALECHPRSEHLVPLFVAAGAGGTDKGHTTYHDTLMGVAVSGHQFG